MTTAAEHVAKAPQDFVVSGLSTVTPVQRGTVDTLPLVVVDAPAYAWDYSAQAAVYALESGFADRYSDLLASAGRELIRPFLAAAWRETHGLTVRFEDGKFRADFGNEVDLPNEAYWPVWQTAADQVTTEALLVAAGFDRDYLRA